MQIRGKRCNQSFEQGIPSARVTNARRPMDYCGKCGYCFEAKLVRASFQHPLSHLRASQDWGLILAAPPVLRSAEACGILEDASLAMALQKGGPRRVASISDWMRACATSIQGQKSRPESKVIKANVAHHLLVYTALHPCHTGPPHFVPGYGFMCNRAVTCLHINCKTWHLGGRFQFTIQVGW